MVTGPAEIPVTIPVDGSTDAIAELLLDHVPPKVSSVSGIVEPTQTLFGPRIADGFGKGFTVTGRVVSEVPHVFVNV